MNIAVTPAARGRPREFCVEDALAAALGVFWRKGYEGASLTDLTEAMGISRPSLYACFGNKEALFRKALDLYEREKLAYMQTALEAPTVRGVAANDALIARFQRSKAEGELPASASPEGLARLLYAVSQGLSVQASNGATAEELRTLVDTALQCWPTR